MWIEYPYIEVSPLKPCSPNSIGCDVQPCKCKLSASKRAYVCASACEFVRAFIRAFMRACECLCVRECVRVCVRVCVRACVREWVCA